MKSKDRHDDELDLVFNSSVGLASVGVRGKRAENPF